MRQLLSVILLLGCVLGPAQSASAADTWPNKPIHFVVPFPAGSVTDLVSRIVVDGLSAKLKQTIVVDNRPGASGELGNDFIARAAPDGYTIGLGTASTLAVAPSLNPQNRRLLVKARVPNADLTLRPGLFANVQASLGERPDVLTIPDSAVVYGSDGTFVWRIDDGQVASTANVEVGVRQDGVVEIRSGLKAGDVVVVAGTNKLAPGINVETVAATATVPAAAPSTRPSAETVS